MTTIEINRLRIFARHGVFEQERRVGNMFEVTVHVDYPADEAVATDRLEATMDYGRAVEIIKKEMAQPSALLEHVAGRIRDALRCEFPLISGGMIKVAKLAPPLSAQLDSVAIRLKF